MATEESKNPTTFITSYECHVCCRLPLGIYSAPEIFQREMQKILGGLEGVVCQMEDILISAKTQQKHDCVENAFRRLSKAGVTLNSENCEFNESSLKFLGHLIESDGIHADPDKTRAISEYSTLKN